MKILVAVKRVLDYNIKVRVKTDESDVDLSHLKMAMNPFDEIAVEQAIQFKEAGVATEVVLVSLGVKKTEEVLRTGLAMGADRAILLETEAVLQPLTVAKLLQQVVLQEQPQLVLLGKQAIDDDANQTGQMLAGLLNWAQGTFASQLELQGEQLAVTREIDGGLETLGLQLPAVITTDLRLNEPRYVKLPNIMKAKKKPLTVQNAAELGVDLTPRLTTLKVTEPPKRQAGIKVTDVATLVDKLKGL